MTTRTRHIIEQGIKVIDKVTIFFGIASGLLGIVLCALVFIAVIFRYFFHSPISWSDEFAAYIYIYHCILALAYATYLESHVSAELLFEKFSLRTRFLITTAGYIAMIACIGIIIYYGGKTTYLYYLREWRSATEHEILLWPVMIVIPFGFLLFLLQCLSRLYACFMRIHLDDPNAFKPQGT